MNILRKKNTILCEYVMLKQAIKECINLFKFSNAKHVKNTRYYYFLFKTNVQVSIHSLKNIFCYYILVDTKLHYPFYESI